MFLLRSEDAKGIFEPDEIQIASNIHQCKTIDGLLYDINHICMQLAGQRRVMFIQISF